MSIFDFTCDARVNRPIQADSRKEAQNIWELFCEAMNRANHCASDTGASFYVALLDGEPVIEQVE